MVIIATNKCFGSQATIPKSLLFWFFFSFSFYFTWLVLCVFFLFILAWYWCWILDIKMELMLLVLFSSPMVTNIANIISVFFVFFLPIVFIWALCATQKWVRWKAFIIREWWWWWYTYNFHYRLNKARILVLQTLFFSARGCVLITGSIYFTGIIIVLDFLRLYVRVTRVHQCFWQNDFH